jgi:hypothetical protein
MKKNTAILNTITKKINFDFKGEIFEVDLTEGDLEDNWNCIEMKDGRVFDVNLSWQGDDNDESEKPWFSAYPVLPNGDGTWSADWSDNSGGIKIVQVIGDKNYYFNDEPHKFNHDARHTFEVFNGEGELQLKTKRFNRACDTAGSAEYEKRGTGWYVEAIDNNGVRLNLTTGIQRNVA